MKRYLTIINIDLIIPAAHDGVIVSPWKFAKCRKACRSHPDLIFFILLNIWRRIFISIAAIRVSFYPIRRRYNLIGSIFGFFIHFFVTTPRNSLASHRVSLILVISIDTEFHWLRDSVIENRICNQTTRIVRFVSMWVDIQWFTLAVLHGRGRDGSSLQLLQIKGIYVSPVILIEISEPIIKKHGWCEVLW